jgi:hypothetical protein
MTVMTITVDDETEAKFRAEVAEHLGTGKGKLGKAVTEALLLWIGKVRQDELSSELKTLMKDGFEMGSIRYSRRRDLHERS